MWSHKHVNKTRKPHRCSWCHRKIPAGSEMKSWASIWEGEFCHGYSCITCDKIMDYVDGTDGFEGGFVAEMLSYSVAGAPSSPEEILHNLIREK